MKIMDKKEKELENLTQVDKSIYEAVEEVENGAKLLDAREALKNLRKNILSNEKQGLKKRHNSWRFFSAGKGGNYVRNQIFIKGTRKVFLSDVSKMRKARQLLQFIFLLCGNFRRYQKPC